MTPLALSLNATTHTTCPYCGVGCGVAVSRSDGVLQPVAGSEEHPANRGRLCVKGSALHETLGQERRLLDPIVDGVITGWDAALSELSQRLQTTIAEHGPQAVALYLSGQLLTEDYYVANKLWKGFIGSANVDTNSRLCMSSAVAAQVRAFGEDAVPACYEDLEIADLVVLLGSNSAWAHPVLHQRLLKTHQARPGMKIVVIDPRRTASCDQADLHLALKPGTDAILFNGLLCYLADHQAIDHTYVRNHTRQYRQTLAAARASACDIASVAEQCGLEVDAVSTFFNWFAKTPRTVTLFSQGINQSSSGTDKGNAIINCHLATGRVGRPGASPFSITGQPNAMGGREVGGLANQLAAHRGFTPESIDAVGRFWQAPNMAQAPGLKAIALFEAIERGEVKFLWIMATNPMVSLPDSQRWKRALRSCDTVVVSDCIQGTDTTALAHILLPATGWGEKDGTVTNSERCISRQRSFLPMAGEAKPDWWALCEVAKRLGFGHAFDFRSSRDIFVEHAALSGINSATPLQFDISALASLDDDAYEQLQPLQWPQPAVIPPGTPAEHGKRLFGDGRFAHADRRARFVPIEPQAPLSTLSSATPLRLNTGRLRDQWHTMTRTAQSERLNRHRPEASVDINPQDAAAFGLANGMIAELYNAYGKAWLRVRVEASQMRGSVFVPIHWSDQFAAKATVNALVPPVVDPHSGQPEFKHASIAIRPFPTQWQALLISTRQHTLSRQWYWSCVPVNGGWLYWLAGNTPFAQIESELRALFEGEETLHFSEAAQREVRLAWVEEERLQAVLILGRRELPSDPWWLTEQLGKPLDKAQRRVLLSGKPSGAQEMRGALICSCFQVGETAIRAAIKGGCNSSAALGKALRCGTNCGSCVPELNRLLQEVAA